MVYTQKDVKEFDRLLSMCESKDNLQRINGRLDYKKFASRFTENELGEMATKIGAKKK